MSRHSFSAGIQAWLWAAVLVPATFVLALGAVLLAAGIGRPTPPAQPPTHAPAGPFVQPEESGALVIHTTVPPALGRAPANLTVRITTIPPVSRSIMEAAGGYFSLLIGGLVTTLPPGWTPDAAGLATLKQAIEDAAPAALAPFLPAGTQITVFADVTAAPERPSP